MTPTRLRRLMLAIAVAFNLLLVFGAPPLGLLDARLAYSPSAALAHLDLLGPDGRAWTLRSALTDLGFIVVYTVTFRLWYRAWKQQMPPSVAKFAPFVPGVFDALETGSIIVMLLTYPAVAGIAVWGAVIGTPLKWVTGAAAVLVLGVAGIRHRRGEAR